MVAKQQGHEYGNRGMSTAGSRYLAMTSEDIEDLVFAVLTCGMCKLLKAL
jgi:hypothetical protein